MSTDGNTGGRSAPKLWASRASAGSGDRRGAARTFERKRRRPWHLLLREARSPLRDFFTGGLELDAKVDVENLERFVADFELFLLRLGVAKEWGRAVELKLRRLGRHRADGLYYPDHRVLVLDTSSWSSFAHEFGHLVDYRTSSSEGSGRPSGTPSHEDGFTRFHELLLSRMREEGRGDPRLAGHRGRLSWEYSASRQECFARAFEQYVSETLPQPSSLVGRPAKYRSDPLYFRRLPGGIRAYFRSLLAAGPEDEGRR